MSNFVRNRFSVETNNYAHFRPGTTVEQRFNDYERLLDADNYYPLSERDVNKLNSEQSFGESNFPELQEETSFIEPGNDTVIDMSTVSETTPLLETAAAGAKGIGSALSVGTPGVLATGTLIGTGLGIGIKKLVDRVSEKGAVLPGSEYIGPGNPMPIGAAKNKADQIAKSHDDDYDKASKWRPSSKMPRFSDRMIHNKFEELVRTADDKAIKLFYENFKDQLDIRSLMAAGDMPRGLSKPPHERPNWANMNEGQKRYAYEQYNLARVRRGLPIDHPIPSLDTGTGTHEAATPSDQVLPSPLDEPQDSQAVPGNQEVEMASNEPTENVGDKRASDTPGPATKRTGSVLPGTGENSTAAETENGESSIIPIPRPRESKYQSIRVFQKVHRLLTYGIAYNILDFPHAYSVKNAQGATTNHQEINYFLTTPMAMVPWDYDFFYLNPSEWTLLPSGSIVLKCEVKVRAENIRIAFPTNASETELATLNQNKFIRVGKGMLQNVPSVNVKYTAFDDNNPMKPTNCELIKNEHLSHLASQFYGLDYTPEKSETWKKTIPNHQIGIPVILNNYLSVVNSAPYGEGWPQIQQFVKEYNAEGMKIQGL
ncbi:capsid protein VP1 [Trichonephila clavata]|uniref:Capsid protein VP1 n=1 Tax=Trichonephila clavata TaxID=2740835 RepID=A0A8X6LFE3_TRICU|nr:capsid protein VP1 [Trichonephila clavata]